MTIAERRVHTLATDRLHEEADAHGIDASMLGTMLEEYRRLYGAEPETLPQLICGVTC